MIASLNVLSIVITIFFISFIIGFFIYDLNRKKKAELQILKNETELGKNYKNYRDLALDLKQKFQQLSNQFFKMRNSCLQVFDHLSLAAAFWDYQSDILQYNSTFARLTGLTNHEGREISIYELPIFGSLLPKMTDSSQNVEIGTMHIKIQKIISDSNCFFIFTDLNAQEIEEKEKRYLTHAIWHEIKTPLTVLKGYTQILLEEIQEPELIEKCQKIDFQIDRLEKVIAQLRHLTRPAVNENFINVQNFIDMIHQILHSWKAEIDDLKLKVQVNAKDTNKYEDSVLEFSQGDLFMVISNLISNAIRFNRSEGLVDVSLLVRQKTLIFEIKDNGPGIPEGIKDLIFKPLGYASFSGEKSQGMGLYLVKEAVRRGGGRLTIRSRADSGTTIRIFIPFH